MLERAQGLSEMLVTLRWEFHRHPKPGYREQQPAQLIASRPADLGIPFRSA